MMPGSKGSWGLHEITGTATPGPASHRHPLYWAQLHTCLVPPALFLGQAQGRYAPGPLPSGPQEFKSRKGFWSPRAPSGNTSLGPMCGLGWVTCLSTLTLLWPHGPPALTYPHITSSPLPHIHCQAPRYTAPAPIHPASPQTCPQSPYPPTAPHTPPSPHTRSPRSPSPPLPPTSPHPQGPSLTDFLCWSPLLLQLLTLPGPWGTTKGGCGAEGPGASTSAAAVPQGPRLCGPCPQPPDMYLWGPCPSPQSICHPSPPPWGCRPPFWVSLKRGRWKGPVSLALGFGGHLGVGVRLRGGQSEGQACTGGRWGGNSLVSLTQPLLLFICLQLCVGLLGPRRPEVIVHCREGEPY